MPLLEIYKAWDPLGKYIAIIAGILIYHLTTINPLQKKLQTDLNEKNKKLDNLMIAIKLNVSDLNAYRKELSDFFLDNKDINSNFKVRLAEIDKDIIYLREKTDSLNRRS